jgi:hypothetical protein
MATYEYDLVPVDRADEPTYGDRLNELAADGWRLVPIVIPETPETNAVLVVEREVSDGGPRAVVRNL